MQNTTNYNLNLPEGTDVVNPLVDYNPNFSTIDNVMKANANRTVGRATCIKSGTTHVVTRSNPDSPIINFTATGDWNEGDTMTIDSTIVSVFLPDGSAALDGAYLINTEVFGILNGTRFTLFSNITDLSAYATTTDLNDVRNIANSKIDAGTDVSEISLPYVQNIGRRLVVDTGNAIINVPVTTNPQGLDGQIVSMWLDYDAVQGMYLKLISASGYQYKVLLSV